MEHDNKQPVWTDDDVKYMRRCIQLAENGLLSTRPNPMVGAVITARGRIIGEGYHVRCGQGHAEVNAFASVRQDDEPLLKEATVYVSLEPCSHWGKTPPCADLIISKGVKRVVVGIIDPFAQVQGRGIRKLREAGIKVEVGLLEDECWWLNRRFFTYHAQQRPYIILKWAQTGDGFIDDHYHPVMISNPQTQMLSHKLRSEEMAILVGHTTAERDKPALNVRHWTGQDPKRIILTHARPLQQLIDDLHQQGIQSLIVEGGRKTLASFIEAGLWDEIRRELSPMTVGDGTPAPHLPADIAIVSHHHYADNTITVYRRKQHKGSQA